MTEPIFARLEHEAATAAGVLLHGITDAFGRHGYHDRNSTASVPEGPQMDFDPEDVAAKMDAELQAAEDKAGEVWNHVKTVIEQHLPQVKTVLAKFGSDPLVKLALDDTVPASIRQIGAEIITRMIAAFPAQPAAVGEVAAAEAAQPEPAGQPA